MSSYLLCSYINDTACGEGVPCWLYGIANFDRTEAMHKVNQSRIIYMDDKKLISNGPFY